MAAIAGAPKVDLSAGSKRVGATAHRVCDSSSLLVGQTKAVEVSAAKEGEKATSILLARLADGSLHAVPNACSHYKLPLTNAVLSGNRLVCPFHGAAFDVRTGDIEDGPGLDCLVPVEATEREGGIFVHLVADEAVGEARYREPSMDAPSAADDRHFVIMGGGTAGSTAVESLRQSGFKGQITVLTKDDLGEDPWGPDGSGVVPFIDRTALSKNMASARGEGKEAETIEDAYSGLGLRPASFYKRLGVSLRSGAAGEVVAVDPTARKIQTKDGSSLSYDKALCATSGPAMRLLGKESELEGVFTLRTPADAQAVDQAIEAAAKAGKPARVAVIGASFIGMESAAYIAKSYGLGEPVGSEQRRVGSITVCDMSDEAFQRVLGSDIGSCLRLLHEAHGVRFVLGKSRGMLKGFVKDEAGEKVKGVKVGDDETVIEADLVLVGAGIVPVAPYLDNEACSKAGVQLGSREEGGGVKVDGSLKATEGLYVAGDLARFPYAHALEGDETHSHLRIEHWDVALDQGRVAGQAMAGKPAVYDKVPFFWTGQLGKNVRYAGHARKWDEQIVVGDVSQGKDAKLSAFYVLDGKVIAVATLQDDPNAAAASELIRRRTETGEDPFPSADELRAARDAGRKVDLRAIAQRVSK